MRIKQHKLILTILIIYTALILYFLFFGVGRPGAAITVHEYRFNLIPNIIQLRFPTLSDFTHFRFFDIGNFAGFIPFGILIPMLYRCNFFRFISFFLLSILILETVQMLTYLGSFDINDAIVNSLGAVVGFCAYKIGFRFKSNRKKLLVTVMSVVILSIGVIGFSELLNKAFTKKEGPSVALNELESNLNVPMDRSLQSFEIGHEKVEPKINLYGSEGNNVEIFTYEFGGKDVVLSLNYGIPDSASDYYGEVIVSVDGKEIETNSIDKEYRDIVSSEFNIDKVNELTITIKGNVKVWDVTFKEMNYWWH
ncbi:VanZ family protein [Sporosarcina sp. Marseille-Q4063]|uniref:VanZ family protein n=1 Tax=Sporosarcina sp. Marseille-Q4063 TaxID=2810514 RepID=UPI001BAF2465|nr:VanZ family protein [Sporosarcina sp. Marseille-Q4063]QUW20731.1 VanZ family protein [Sporosarcina sp. Marseille-Q4063]